MIRINLLPFRTTRKKENIRQQFFIFIVLFAAVFGGLLFYNGNLKGKIDNLNRRIQATKDDIKKYEAKAKQVEDIRKQLAMLQQKLDVINQLEANRELAFQLVNTMPDMIVKDRMWLLSMDAKEKAPKKKKTKGKKGGKKKKVQQQEASVVSIQLNIKGVALDNKTVADFMIRMEETGYFKNITLKNLAVKQFKKEKVTLKNFHVTCNMQPKSAAKKAKGNTVAGK